MSGRPLEARLGQFIDALDAELARAAGDDGELEDVLTQIRLDVSQPLAPHRGRGPQYASATCHLPRALMLAKQGPESCAALARALSDLADDLIWIQNPNYTAENLSADYLANYAYSDLIGPRGLADAQISVGILLLGPGLHYPEHHHPAEELYLVLAGDAQWRRGEDAWCARPPGAWIHHPPWTRHATKSGAEPLLALYVWRGALDQPAELCAD